jgi:hypothetical protein
MINEKANRGGVVTEVNHKGYTLYLSKNGPEPLREILRPDVIDQDVQTMVQSKPTTTQTANQSKGQSSSSTSGVIDRSKFDFEDDLGHLYRIDGVDNIEGEIDNVDQFEIPEDVTRIIQKDMSNEPNTLEHSYKVVINRNIKDNGGRMIKEPQVVRLTVVNPKALNRSALRRIEDNNYNNGLVINDNSSTSPLPPPGLVRFNSNVQQRRIN